MKNKTTMFDFQNTVIEEDNANIILATVRSEHDQLLAWPVLWPLLIVIYNNIFDELLHD